jgi:microcystin-dependent protein
VTLGSTFILPTSTADNWHGEVGSHGHIGSTAQAAGDHAHAVTATVSGISTQNAGAGAAVENRPPFLAVNFIIRAL